MFDPHNDLHRVGSLDELRTHYRHPHAGTRGKERPALDAASATVAERCRFATIGTFDVLGNADVSPRGGPSGFIRVLDPTHLAMADLGGNNRLDTLENIVATGRVALLLITPGKSETVRVNGAAFVSTDPARLPAAQAAEGGHRDSGRDHLHALREGVHAQWHVGPIGVGRAGRRA